MVSKVYDLSTPNNETENVNIYIVKLKCMIEFHYRTWFTANPREQITNNYYPVNNSYFELNRCMVNYHFQRNRLTETHKPFE